jgi:hypothetical protein
MIDARQIVLARIARLQVHVARRNIVDPGPAELAQSEAPKAECNGFCLALEIQPRPGCRRAGQPFRRQIKRRFKVRCGPTDASDSGCQGQLRIVS